MKVLKLSIAVLFIILQVSCASARPGITGEYGFISCSVLGPEHETDIRERVATMARDYGIREFMFYDWFADYSTPVKGAEWKEAYFRRGVISLATIKAALDEVHKNNGRAWAYVQAVAAEEDNLESPSAGISKITTKKGEWYWHPSGEKNPRFPAYLPNAAWARFMVGRWAPAVKELGFDGIHWDTLGHIHGNLAEETSGIHEFLKTAGDLLEQRGLRQTVNLVDMNWWDRDIILKYCEFPYVEAWSTETEKRYYAEMDDPRMGGARGVIAMYPATLMPKGWTQTEVIIARHNEARKHNLVYLIVGDGARRMINEYWPKTVPLNDTEQKLLLQHGYGEFRSGL
ncbi:MAG TPA: hypothetical protein DET40_02455 [Lentisphaeria bacterium]|nr:MAG: hypothetical protein A2X45_25800 [Lentisphaerae bacterium GWF2_50_93]HCE42394.1 hypothetical protein [Lentisphaeria bacterium]